MRNGPIPLNLHAAIEPFIGLLLILAPWIFAFSDIGDAKWVSIIVGALVIVGGMMTRWRYSLVKLIPLSVHFVWDIGIGAFLIVAPFIFGFDDASNPTVVMIVLGVLEIGAALMTRWVPEDEYQRHTPTHGAPA